MCEPFTVKSGAKIQKNTTHASCLEGEIGYLFAAAGVLANKKGLASQVLFIVYRQPHVRKGEIEYLFAAAGVFANKKALLRKSTSLFTVSLTSACGRRLPINN